MCPETSSGSGGGPPSPPRLTSTAGFVPVVAVVAVVLLYSLLIVQQLLLGALVASWVIGLYVAWRFVRWFVVAYRRRTAAMESMADSLEALTEQEGTGPVFHGDGETR